MHIASLQKVFSNSSHPPLERSVLLQGKASWPGVLYSPGDVTT